MYINYISISKQNCILCSGGWYSILDDSAVLSGAHANTLLSQQLLKGATCEITSGCHDPVSNPSPSFL